MWREAEDFSRYQGEGEDDDPPPPEPDEDETDEAVEDEPEATP